jgi:hypothetical protein
MPRDAALLLLRWRPCQASEPSAHHRSLSFIHDDKDGSYECATPVEHCTMGAPLGRTVADSMVQFGEELRRVDNETGGKQDDCVLVFLERIVRYSYLLGNRNKSSPRIQLSRRCYHHKRILA